MVRVTAELRGANAMKRALMRLGAEAPKELGAALYAEAEATMARSKTIVPVETGALRSSGHVRLPKLEGPKVTVQMGYGGAAAPYAAAVHERLHVRHKSPTRAKYLEHPFRESTLGLLGRIAGRIRMALVRFARRGTA